MFLKSAFAGVQIKRSCVLLTNQIAPCLVEILSTSTVFLSVYSIAIFSGLQRLA